MNSALNYASAADAATTFKMVQSVRMAPFKKIGQLSFGMDPRNKCPPTLLRPPDAVRQLASEWQFRTMSDA